MPKKNRSRRPKPPKQNKPPKNPPKPPKTADLLVKMVGQIQEEINQLQTRVIPTLSHRMGMALANAGAADRRAECRSLALLKMMHEGGLEEMSGDEVAEKYESYVLEAMAVHSIIYNFGAFGEMLRRQEEEAAKQDEDEQPEG
jgi:hypothetical protein